MAKSSGDIRVSKASFLAVGKSQFMFGRPILMPKRNEETGEQYEARTWIHRLNLDEEGYPAVSGMAFQKSLAWASGWLNIKIPGGGGKSTYKKRFVAGVMPAAASYRFEGLPAMRPEHLEEDFLKIGYRLDLFVDSKGQAGGKNPRVWRFYPCLRAGWKVRVEMLVVDQIITEEIFYKHVTTAGLFDGMGSMRKSTGNGNGMYTVEDYRFEPFELA